MDSWGEVSQINAIKVPRRSSLALQSAQKGVTAILFDDAHDLIWLGDSSGYVYSFYNLKLQPYVSYRPHKGPIMQILNHKKGLVTVSSRGVRLSTTQGQLMAQVTCSAEHGGLRCMSYTSNTQTELWVGGKASATGGRVFVIDLVNGKVSGQIRYDHDLSYMTTNFRYVLLGRADGCVDMVDPKTQRIVKTFRCHAASLSSMYVQGNTLYTTGYSLKKDRFVPDPLVNCFDLLNQTAKPPLAFPAGPAHVYLHPKISNLALIASNMGQFHFVDIYNPSKMQIYQAELSSYVTFFAYAPSGDCLAFVDGMQNLHLWARIPSPATPATLPSFAVYSQPVELPSLDVEPIPDTIRLNFEGPSLPLNAVKVPHYDEMLLSAWPPDLLFLAGSVPQPIDYEVLRGLTSRAGIPLLHYDKSRLGPRNAVRRYKKQEKLSVPKFISENDASDSASGDEDDSYIDYTNGNVFSLRSPNEQHDDIPNAFRFLRIAYSKFGVDDFDFAYYNKTAFSGLEADVGNNYSNSVLQLYRFNAPLCNFILSTLSHDVADQNLVLVELAYLFDMLIKAKGEHCAASNFQRVFSAHPEAAARGLVTDEGMNYDDNHQRKLVMLFNRFVLECIAEEEHSLGLAAMDGIAGVPAETAALSNFCNLRKQNATTFHSLDINSVPLPPAAPATLTILNYIEASMDKKVDQVVDCSGCGQRHPIEMFMRIQNLPGDLILNIDLPPGQLNEIRLLKGWLLPEFELAGRTFHLSGYVCQVTDRINRSHLVTITRVPNEDTNKVSANWCLFNDFLVTPIDTDEVYNLSHWWKKPVVVIYTEHQDEFVYDSYRPHFDDSILYRDHFASGTREGKIVEYELLTRQEAPKPGTMVAIDAEFVQLAPPQFEISFHRAKKLVKPKKLALGRISVLLCEGEDRGKCFIDDYIVASERIDDYITSFSGIEPGDLDPEKSKRTLVTLQTAYRKMWLLLNLGCIFVGHSLKGDFRMINIKVPKSQVRDTAELFYLRKEKRKLSLKYLVYQLFHDNVQTGNHDSIEDADSAMRLYTKYLELKENGTFENTLQDIYLEGQLSGFRIK